MFDFSLITILVLLCIFVVVVVALLENDRYIIGSVFTVAVVGAAYFLFKEVSDYVTAWGWETILLYHIPTYFVIGVTVAFLKWIQVTAKFASALKEVRNKFKDFDPESKEHLRKLLDAIKSEANYTPVLRRLGVNCIYRVDVASLDELVDEVTPKARKHVDRISSWIVIWPFVVLHVFLADGVMKAGRYIASLFDGLFGRLTRAIVANGLK